MAETDAARGLIMTSDRAARLQEQWKRNGNHTCEHEHAQLERTQAGFLTGSYFCLQCGIAIRDFRPPKP
jgi:hypothetical protein